MKRQNGDRAVGMWIIGAIGLGIVLPVLSMFLAALVTLLFGEALFQLFVISIVVFGFVLYGWLSGLSPLLLTVSSAGAAFLVSIFTIVVLEPLTEGELFLMFGTYLVSVVAFVVVGILYWIATEVVNRGRTGRTVDTTNQSRFD